MRAEILSVGTELLLGTIVDTNAAYIATRLAPLGIDVYWISQVGDNLGRLSEIVQRALSRSDLLVITGGLGPTEDDLTREAISAVLGEPMEVQSELEADLRGWFKRRGVPMPERNVKQATLIKSAQTINNPIGTAPGWRVERDGRMIVAMPGVPHEMRRMWENEIEPILRERTGTGIIFSRTLKIIGLGESAAEEAVHSLIASTNPTLATYAKNDGVHLRITAKAPTQSDAVKLVDEMGAKVRELIDSYVYGVDEETLAGSVGRRLIERGLTLGLLEAASGGMLCFTIGEEKDSPQYLAGALTALTAEALVDLGVSERTIEEHGITSLETTQKMATAARERTGADVGLAISGVLGPEEERGQPVGTVHVALDFQGEIDGSSTHHRTTRTEIKRRAVLAALNLLRLKLIGVR